MRAASSLGVLVGVAICMAAAPPVAAAAQTIDVQLTVAGETPRTVYGSDTDTGPQVPVSSATTLFEVDFGSVSDTNCELLSADGQRLHSQEWYGGDENFEGIRRFSIPEGVLVDGRRYTVACLDGNFSAVHLDWNVIATDSRASAVERLDRDPNLVVRTEVVRAVFLDRTVIPPSRPGDRLRLVGPVGVWEPGPDIAVSVGEVPAAASVNDDGSALELTIPALRPGRAIIDATTTTTIGSSPTRVQRTRFFGSVEILGSAVTSTQTSISMSSSRVAFTTARATVRVSTSDSSASIGEVVIYGDGRVIARRAMAASDNGTVVVALPRLTRGSHVITATFSPAGSAEPSTSAPKRLRQLI